MLALVSLGNDEGARSALNRRTCEPYFSGTAVVAVILWNDFLAIHTGDWFEAECPANRGPQGCHRGVVRVKGFKVGESANPREIADARVRD